MTFNPKPSYSYQDIGLIPLQKSEVESRSSVNTHILFLDKDLAFPILGAPMHSAMGHIMAHALESLRCMAVLPRTEDDPSTDAELYTSAIDSVPSLPARLGQRWMKEYMDVRWACNKKAPPIICIDTANGFQKATAHIIKWVKKLDPTIKIIAGNVGSVEGYKFMSGLGVDAVRVGIGNGSVCSTSVATGVGMGQASLVREIAEYRDASWGPSIIADGGIWTAGDIAKAIALGADVVMVGRLLAGCEESPGEVIKYKDKKYKQYAGQASFAVKRSKHYVEGDDTLVRYQGGVEEVFGRLDDGLRSAMSYMNAKTLEELRGQPDEAFRLLVGAAGGERQVYA